MPDVNPAVNRGTFLRNTAKGGIVLAGSAGVIAAVEGVVFAGSASAATASDITTLQAAYTAESLAVVVYSAIIKNFKAFKLQNLDYFQAALKNEMDHKAFLASALGSKTPTNLKFKIPASVTKNGQSVLNTGVALETAFVEAYLGAVETFSSLDLKLVAAKVAANEATHFSFFDAAAGAGKGNFGGHGVLPSLPSTATIPATVEKLKPFLG
jgi:rubrerythrin